MVTCALGFSSLRTSRDSTRIATAATKASTDQDIAGSARYPSMVPFLNRPAEGVPPSGSPSRSLLLLTTIPDIAVKLTPPRGVASRARCGTRFQDARLPQAVHSIVALGRRHFRITSVIPAICASRFVAGLWRSLHSQLLRGQMADAAMTSLLDLFAKRLSVTAGIPCQMELSTRPPIASRGVPVVGVSDARFDHASEAPSRA
jgi:hypothetical protein